MISSCENTKLARPGGGFEHSSQWPNFDDRNKQLLIDQLSMFDANKDPGKFVLGEFLIYQGMFVNCRRCRKQRAVMDG